MIRRNIVFTAAVCAVAGLLAVEPLGAGEKPVAAVAPFNNEQARGFQQSWAKHLDKPVVETNSIGMEMTLIPPGEFLMGGTQNEIDEALAEAKNRWKKRDWFTLWSGWVKSEAPQHRVKITRPFYFGATEVTVGQFRHFVEATNYKTAIARAPNPKKRRAEFPKLWMRGKFVDPPSEDCPASYISWTDAVAFCQWLSEKEGVRYRLPSEAEWEYACRAGTQTKWFFGDDVKLFPQYMQFATDPAKGPMFVVGRKKPNPFGLFDMHGGVYEWCSDWFAGDYYQNSPVDDPQGPESANPTYWPEQLPMLDPGLDREQASRVTRGGAFNFTDTLRLRSAHRIGLGTTGGHWHLGFRIVKAIPEDNSR